MKFDIPEYVNMVLNRLEEYGYEAFVVGGSVRDLLLARDPSDYDIATNAEPEEIEYIFRDLKTIAVGKEFGTIIVVQEQGLIEVTTYRVEGDYLDGRRPSHVIFSSKIEDDLSRRDFTINSIAYNEKVGLIDPFNGGLDLEKGLIRTVGTPEERFKEDHLRILRGVRFASQLGFNLEEDTYMACKAMSHLLSIISVERIREELFKILLSFKPSYGIGLMNDLGILDIILPELKATVGFEQNNPHHDKDVFNHTLCVVDGVSDKLEIRLAALFHDIGKPSTFTVDEEGIGHFYGHEEVSVEMTRDILTRLRCSNELIKSVSLLIGDHMTKSRDMKDKGLKRLITRVGEKRIFHLLELQKIDRMCTNSLADISFFEEKKEDVIRILESHQAYEKKQLEIDGYDIINLGYKQGKILGDILDYLMERVLDDPTLNHKEKLIELVKNKYKLND